MLSGDKDEAIRRIKSPDGLSIEEAIEILKPEVDEKAAILNDAQRQVYQFIRENFGYGENKKAFAILVKPGQKRRFKDMAVLNPEETRAMIEWAERRAESLREQISKLEAWSLNLQGLERNYRLDFGESTETPQQYASMA